MTVDFLSRIIGLFAFAIIGGRFGGSLADTFNLSVEATAVIFSLVGVLFGLIVTPWITIRPIRFIRSTINQMPADKLIMSLIGGVFGLIVALLLSYPLSLLDDPFGSILPAVISVLGGYLGVAVFNLRANELLEILNSRSSRVRLTSSLQSRRNLILDSSALIDGRIVDVAETGFLGGTLILPTFILSELQQVADSADALRRNRGRRGLNMVNKLRRNDYISIKVVDEDFADIPQVDDKLIALAIEMSAAIITNDYNLNQVAEAQNVFVLNVNQLSNAVRSLYIPGETFAIRILQEGKDPKQGIGYLDDGTIVIVENGKNYLDRTVQVTVTKMITRDTGRMIFAVPENEFKEYQRIAS